MDFVTTNIHMDTTRCKIESQFTVEQDCNLADSKPDVTNILLSDGFVKLEEMRCSEGELLLRGKLLYKVLYASEDDFGSLQCMQGKIPFEECIHVEDLCVTDSPQITLELEHLQVSAVNSRKLSLRGLLLVSGVICDIQDACLSTGVEDNEQVEIHHKSCNVLNTAVMKKDICRIREEVKLPSSMPEIGELLWEQTELCNLEFRPEEDRLLIKGDISLLILYTAREENRHVECFETMLPFNTTIECNGSREGLIPHITHALTQKEFDILPDMDGVERILGLDLVCDLCIRLYEDMSVSLIDDLYGIRNNIRPEFAPCNTKKLLALTCGKMRLEKEASLGHGEGILQILCCKAVLCPERCKPGNEGIEIEGYLGLQILYLTEDDRFPYRTQRTEIPFNYVIDVPGMSSALLFELETGLEHCQISASSGDEVSVKCIASFRVFAYEEQTLTTVCGTTPDAETDSNTSTSTITVYYVKEGDSLWNIGKDCLTPLNRIREENHLSSDHLVPGQKLIVMR